MHEIIVEENKVIGEGKIERLKKEAGILKRQIMMINKNIVDVYKRGKMKGDIEIELINYIIVFNSDTETTIHSLACQDQKEMKKMIMLAIYLFQSIICIQYLHIFL